MLRELLKQLAIKNLIFKELKNYIFMDKHDLGNGVYERFSPDYMMGESWRRLIDGAPKTHDLTLIKHELMENELMERGCTQAEAHDMTLAKYNYGKEASEFYDQINKYKKE